MDKRRISRNIIQILCAYRITSLVEADRKRNILLGFLGAKFNTFITLSPGNTPELIRAGLDSSDRSRSKEFQALVSEVTYGKCLGAPVVTSHVTG